MIEWMYEKASADYLISGTDKADEFIATVTAPDWNGIFAEVLQMQFQKAVTDLERASIVFQWGAGEPFIPFHPYNFKAYEKLAKLYQATADNVKAFADAVRKGVLDPTYAWVNTLPAAGKRALVVDTDVNSAKVTKRVIVGEIGFAEDAVDIELNLAEEVIAERRQTGGYALIVNRVSDGYILLGEGLETKLSASSLEDGTLKNTIEQWL
jgi:hypothetical protein